jgi:hypothetical protein
MADAKYLIITHEHGDHFNGAGYLQRTYGVRVIASDIAWAGITGANAPTKDISIVDGQTMTFGDTTVSFTVTPGHTPGATSLVFPVYDLGVKRNGRHVRRVRHSRRRKYKDAADRLACEVRGGDCGCERGHALGQSPDSGSKPL